MFGATVKITRFVDDVQPGIVECELNDAFGVVHKFVDKVPIFYADHLDENSSYPVEGVINFEIVEKKAKTSIITTELPWHVESLDGRTVFEISNSEILEFPNHIAQVISVQIGNLNYPLTGKKPIDISIPLKFNGSQPNAYGVERAVSEPVKAGDLVGDTRLGGSVNFEQYTFIPHCNGTHTECVGHITNERVSVRDCLQDVLMPAVLVSVEPAGIDGTNETYSTNSENHDHLITKKALIKKLASLHKDNPQSAIRDLQSTALIVRTLPNDDSKLTQEYGEKNIPPYFSSDAMEYIVELGIKHLLVDMPSIDRTFDDGKLLNHRIFWNVEPGSFEVNENTRMNNTITEMVYVPNSVSDGEYLLNLQIAPFESDCAPSRPVLFKSD